MSVSKILFQSNSDEWETPQQIFDLFDSEFNFNLDACAAASFKNRYKILS